MTDDALLLFDESTSWETAQATLDEQGLGDGLPLVMPTQRRLEAMLAGIDQPGRSRGPMPPLFGELTPAAVAYNCVLAGARPGDLPAVLTAAMACLEADFNLLGILTTTGTTAVAMLVHGPMARTLGINGGTNCLGPGVRANATIGRALALVLRNIGGARPQVGDMATMGQPGKYTFCFAENDEAIFPPLPLRRGMGADAVSVLGVSGTAEILPAGDGDTPEAILRSVATAMAVAASVAARKPARGEQVLLLPPELARFLVQHGWDLARVQRHLFDAHAVAAAPGAIHVIVTGGPGVKMTHLPLWAGGTRVVTRPIGID
ncbi:hypothetical protein [Reyranella sp. CPCC 100927]|uniref:hypothetical protein n=1 Tax=Reyranella sp. CPCC 100927 TaxID=2599616 RepID=UPI0011B368BE|nr:hypothetical protein [Reyranella sp. CPCC 100927]TWT01189.1 hypothetical protein FQU96_32410 [Reyranella sp. CPCC 100927]